MIIVHSFRSRVQLLAIEQAHHQQAKGQDTHILKSQAKCMEL